MCILLVRAVSDLPQQTVILVMRTYPEPDDVAILDDPYGAVVYVHTHRIYRTPPSNALEVQTLDAAGLARKTDMPRAPAASRSQGAGDKRPRSPAVYMSARLKVFRFERLRSAGSTRLKSFGRHTFQEGFGFGAAEKLVPAPLRL